MNQSNKPRESRALYISYDGLLEPLGQSQITPYVLSIAQSGVRIHVVSFEKDPDLRDVQRCVDLRHRLETHGIAWTHLRYHKRPRVLSTLLDILVGTWTCCRHARRDRVSIVHARSYVPALMALVVKAVTRTAFVFDLRGFWPEERVELGILSANGLLFRCCKLLENRLLERADRLVVLTHRAKEILVSRPDWRHRPNDIEVIPCCVDRSRFLRSSGVPSRIRSMPGRWIVGNIGAVNQRYLVSEMFRFFLCLKRLLPNIYFVYLTRQPAADVEEHARMEGLETDDLLVTSVDAEEVPQWLSAFQLGIFFLKPTYAAQASSYTKLGEFLASGVPVVTNAGVGDVEQILCEKRTGVLVREFTVEAIEKAAREARSLLPLDEDRRKSCRLAAASHFDLKDGCERYVSVYQSLLSTSEHSWRPSLESA